MNGEADGARRIKRLKAVTLALFDKLIHSSAMFVLLFHPPPTD